MCTSSVAKVFWAVSFAAAQVASANWSVTDFDWNSVTPSSTLKFTPCYNATHQCAKLQVPLDWLDPDNDALDAVTIAVIKRPAVVDENDPTFGGTIITNPGGPGGPGVAFALGWGKGLQEKADSEAKKYAILSFDPRGVGLTTPAADCHRDEFARGVWKLENRAIGPVDGGHAAVAQKAARAVVFGQLCDDAGGEHGIHRFMSTTSVARDMIKMVDDLDDIRRAASSKGDRLELRDSQEPSRLLYWGFSYGSALGQYFASIYPGRVGRMILEGIVDIHDYHHANGLTNLWDTQETFEYLWNSCYEAQDDCALYRHGDRGPGNIEKRLRGFLEQLEQEPAPYLHNRTVVSISSYDVRGVIFQGLYDPLTQFQSLAEILKDSMNGNFTGLYSRLQLPDHTTSGLPSSYTWMRDAMVAVTCGDAVSRANVSIPEIEETIKQLKKDSPDFGPEWARHLYECRGWTARPKYRFEGPWGMGPADPGLVEGKPAAPVFFITNKADTVTPRENAYVAAKSYAGSRVLLQHSVGHCATSWPSKCTADHIKRYWDAGELPPEGSSCDAECTPFKDCPESVSMVAQAHFMGM
ncbi:Alpha/Beta hydrolase protein [Microdochium trichocladiopsis]|uniref:Alpha/Beta hydrolase protein n=1 Tax=Microdochium trichocladiopsis TaxID=1682393 RepID=A0A9P8Y308_9PEZI|nr:Alpha/Beta hydrolase protein [Microdochium trichocladiopsis]KAH7028771.1 Alpha/Beta hydrolase protein [Microdochium trichocladiopsis]